MSLISNLWSRLTGTKATPAEEAHVMATKLLKEVRPAFIRARPGPLSKTVVTSFRMPVGGTVAMERVAKFFSQDLISHAGWANLAILQESEVHELRFVVPRTAIKPEVSANLMIHALAAPFLDDPAYLASLPTLSRRYENADGSEETYRLREFCPMLVVNGEETATITARFVVEYEMTKPPKELQ